MCFSRKWFDQESRGAVAIADFVLNASQIYFGKYEVQHVLVTDLEGYPKKIPSRLLKGVTLNTVSRAAIQDRWFENKGKNTAELKKALRTNAINLLFAIIAIGDSLFDLTQGIALLYGVHYETGIDELINIGTWLNCSAMMADVIKEVLKRVFGIGMGEMRVTWIAIVVSLYVIFVNGLELVEAYEAFFAYPAILVCAVCFSGAMISFSLRIVISFIFDRMEIDCCGCVPVDFVMQLWADNEKDENKPPTGATADERTKLLSEKTVPI